MRKVYLEGVLGDKFGHEWNLDVASPSEALQAIAVQRQGFKQYLIDAADSLAYEIVFGDKELERPDGVQTDLDMIHPVPVGMPMHFVPVVEGSKSRGLSILVGMALIAATGGFAAIGIQGFGAVNAAGTGGTGLIGGMAQNAAAFEAVAGGAALSAQAFSGIGFLGSMMSSVGMMMVAGQLLQMLSPQPDTGDAEERAENYLFSGAVNTTRQGGPVPLVYGRILTGSSTISASIFTQTARSKAGASSKRKLVGISNFRTPGSKYGQNTNTGSYGRGGGGRGGGGGGRGGRETGAQNQIE
jgi:predicted phage tail protein